MLEENKALSRRFIEGYVQGDSDIVDELLAPDFVFYDPSSATGAVPAEDMKASIEWIHSAFPDAQVTIEDQVAQGGKVVTRLRAHATHTGDLMGIPPTGKRVTIQGISIWRIADGKIEECWFNYDALGLMRQLGVVPKPEEQPA